MRKLLIKYINDEGVMRSRIVYFEGVANNILRRYKSGMTRATREAMAKYIKEDSCRSCKGQRLKPEILSVYVADKKYCRSFVKCLLKTVMKFSKI